MTNHEAAANEWMDRHPEAMALFRRFSLSMLERGRRTGIGALTERVRWEFKLAEDERSTFKINNNHRAYIARRLIAEDPRLAAIFELRAAGGDGAPHEGEDAA